MAPTQHRTDLSMVPALKAIDFENISKGALVFSYRIVGYCNSETALFLGRLVVVHDGLISQLKSHWIVSIGEGGQLMALHADKIDRQDATSADEQYNRAEDMAFKANGNPGANTIYLGYLYQIGFDLNKQLTHVIIDNETRGWVSVAST
ncbi:hypothetical protein LZ554_009322 [Drepanopeziza brunnea f. sp. 'monogermtubi']|nr:hypothetical protein LZ554_009322 [Drepanopeziza brunnea f. sp. 'monogermtubi']